MMMMMNSSTIITTRIHVLKLPHNHRNYRNTSCSSLLSSNPPKFMTMVHNNKSPVSQLSDHHFNCDTNTDDNVFINNADDDAFTAELDLTDTYSFTSRKVIRVFTYGVGSNFKLALANQSGMNDIIGMDLVAMNFNHLVTCGAKPMLYSNFLACSTKELEISGNVSSVGLALTESPFIDGKNIEAGDVLIGLPSSGIHSHGFSLVKRVIEQSGSSLQDNLPGTDITLGESLLTPTAMYVEQVLDIISQSKGGVKGIAYIARGGFTENIPKLFQKGLGAVIVSDSWPIPPIFKWIQEAGNIEDIEMTRTFNMGIGMVLVMSKESARKFLRKSRDKNIVYRNRKVVSGDGVRYREKSIRQKAAL